MKPFTYSLGHPKKFEALATIARNNGDWRKVARMIQKYNVLSSTRPDGKMIRMRDDNLGANYNKRNTYICRAAHATKISEETRQAIYELFHLTSFVTRFTLMIEL